MQVLGWGGGIPLGFPLADCVRLGSQAPRLSSYERRHRTDRGRQKRISKSLSVVLYVKLAMSESPVFYNNVRFIQCIKPGAEVLAAHDKSGPQTLLAAARRVWGPD